MTQPSYLGIDLGGTKIAGGIVRPDGSIEDCVRVPTGTTAKQAEDRLFGVVGLLIEKASPRSAIEGLSVAAPGPLDRERGVLIAPPNLPFRDFRLKEALEREFGVEVSVEKDTNAAAYGEYLYGAGSKASCRDPMLYVAVGTGIGAGLIIRGEVYRGFSGLALEIGHMTLDPEGPQCRCGARGCFEAIASGAATMKRAREMFTSSSPGLGKPLGIQALLAMARENSLARSLLDKLARNLAAGISSAMNLLDPALVVLGGGIVSGAVEDESGFLRQVTDGILERSFRRFLPGNHVPIALSELEEGAAITGGVALLRRMNGG